jgi:stress-induced-phosphoprotein 1
MHWVFFKPLSSWVVLQVYSNRAACYTKLGALPEGLKDAEKCIELDPTFSKGYTRKGAIQFFMKEYDKALETYQAGLKHDPKNQELLDGVRRYNTTGRDHAHLTSLH